MPSKDGELGEQLPILAEQFLPQIELVGDGQIAFYPACDWRYGLDPLRVFGNDGSRNDGAQRIAYDMKVCKAFLRNSLHILLDQIVQLQPFAGILRVARAAVIRGDDGK